MPGVPLARQGSSFVVATILTLVIVFGLPRWTKSEDKDSLAPPREYRFNKAMGVVTVPLKVNGVTRRFGLVTVTGTRFDSRFADQLPEIPESSEEPDRADSLAMRFRVPPTASLLGRQLRFPGGFVACYDVNGGLRDELPELDGAIGLGPLLTEILQIDVQRGLVRSLPAVPDDAGMKLRITSLYRDAPLDCVKVAASVADEPEQEFYVMLERDDSFYVNDATYRKLVLSKKVRHNHLEGTVGPLCGSIGMVGTADSVRVGTDVQHGVRVRHDGDNAIGLGFLSRYVVTFDFPRRCMYLKKEVESQPDGSDVTGLRLIWRDDCAAVESIFPTGALHATTLAPGDEILRVDDLPVKRETRIAVRNLLRDEGRSISLRIRRENEEFMMEVTLKSEADFIMDEGLIRNRIPFPPSPPPMPEPPELPIVRQR